MSINCFYSNYFQVFISETLIMLQIGALTMTFYLKMERAYTLGNRKKDVGSPALAPACCHPRATGLKPRTGGLLTSLSLPPSLLSQATHVATSTHFFSGPQSCVLSFGACQAQCSGHGLASRYLPSTSLHPHR